MIYTTLERIRAEGPCSDGWVKLLGNLDKTKADDEPLAFDVILASNGIEDALWCLRSVDEPVLCRLLAVKFARQVQHLMKDPRSIAALDVAERFASGLASAEELTGAREDADAASYASYAFYAAADAFYAAANAAANATASYAFYAADAVAYAAADAYAEARTDADDYAEAYAEARTDAMARQSEIFLEMLKETA